MEMKAATDFTSGSLGIRHIVRKELFHANRENGLLTNEKGMPDFLEVLKLRVEHSQNVSPRYSDQPTVAASLPGCISANSTSPG